jgi:diadenosine tetraphosphate (Ap4A) HIT family hydrolase
VTLDRLWAGWRASYISTVATQAPADGCLFCALPAEDHDEAGVIVTADDVYAVLNAYPYTSGHLLVAPRIHCGDLAELPDGVAAALMTMMQRATRAVQTAYAPDGINVGINLGRAAGAGIPGHLHVHVLPRWVGDTNFLTSVAEARVLPEALSVTRDRLRAAWPT